MRTGQQYLQSLADGRTVIIGGARVEDVTRDPAFEGIARTVATMYDVAADPSNGMIYTSPETGKEANKVFMIPRSREDLAERRLAISTWAEITKGFVGRSPDHVGGFLAGFASSPETFDKGGRPFGQNISRLYRQLLDESLFVTYVIIPPQFDRSVTAHGWNEELLQVGVLEERADGMVVRGAQMLGTSTAVSDWLFVSCIRPLAPQDERYAISFAVPVNAKGLKMYCRRPYAPSQPSCFDYPLSSRFDESDAYVVFDNVFVSLLRAGEQSGRLAEVFENLAASLKWQDELVSQTKRLLIYPALVLVVVTAVVVFLLIYLVPQVTGLLRTMGVALPMQTKVLIYTSNFIIDYWPLVFGAPVALAAALVVVIRRNPKAAYLWDHAKLHLPVTGPILQKIILARFANFFALMYQSGITVLDALKTSEDIVDNRVIADGLMRAGQQINAGESLTETFQNLGLFPPLVIRMLRVGEATGAIDVALRNVNYFYTRDVREAVDKALKLLEPSLTLMLGLVLAFIMWSVLGPVYDILGKMKF